MYDPAAGTDIDRIQDWLETIGVDNYAIKVDSPKILSNAKSLLIGIQQYLSTSVGRIVAIKITEHNRSYGDSSHYGLSITVSVPRQKTHNRPHWKEI